MSVGIVLVSHSPELAGATAEMAGSLAGTDVTIAPAGGTDDGRFGTSIELIQAAVGDADGGDGVCVVMDMGSSVLTAKTLLTELEDDDDGPAVRLADAPFVEGAVAASVLASTGQDLDAVVRAAEDAWAMRKL
ncbi:dihydroxyacetone kinase phosphotransfer subunit [Haloactinopolyspora alba]|uniref:phosphoenolpyruvate--glycerone phosphotransferase n=1 Tax=Haloactinopolyspora alba TaxID=648780 RepID=A0A2P8DJ68_9ACTN|nr:dihydroxyacetone kinase phosphoryl donor subunit DhaM [Haloactinopolyspora alba]PSK97241.1 dihydroxyacetone kinase phosphotransfer subunit [Haloactinopolyspora alba]